MEVTRQEIDFFLHLGYFPRYEPKVPLDFSGAQTGFEGDLYKQAVDLFCGAVSRDFKSGARHVVPLSGGLDSRAILCALMECTDAANIETYTFGVSGARDFEMGAAVARAAGVRHRAIDLGAHEWSAQELHEIARRQDGQTFLFHHIPLDVMEEYKDAVIWSGYIGDAVTGGHSPKSPAADMDAAKMKYLKSRAESDLYRGNLMALLPMLSVAECGLSHEEKILFSAVGKITAPHVLMEGMNYKTPFINNAFFDFCIGLPREQRFGRRLFKKAFGRAFDLFKLPSTANVPLWRRALCRIKYARLKQGENSFARNYFDFDMKLRSDENFAALIRAGLDDLKSRGIVEGIDIDAIWHVRRARDIKMLYSLETNLKVNA